MKYDINREYGFFRHLKLPLHSGLLRLAKGMLTVMPKTYIETAEYDCLHDEGVALYERLNSAGVSCTIVQTEGTMHGFDVCPKAPTTLAAVDRRMSFIKHR